MNWLDELYPDAAPAWFQLEMAYRVLELLGGRSSRTLDQIPPGVCDDCQHERRRRYRFGNRSLCLDCANRRRNVAARRAA